MQKTVTPYQELASAIILEAVKDYRSSQKTKNHSRINEIRRFFRSDYFSVLSDLDPEAMIKKLDEEVAHDKAGA